MAEEIIIRNFAPVLIPTLNRYTHFKNCIESLMQCTHADKTDVIIGLDYPLKEFHWEGYNKIKDYLKSIEIKHNFKNLIIIKRDHNFGVGSNGNLNSLIKETLNIYESYILTEDDNVFSPAFLDYCNKGLIKFKDDKSVIAICGYKYFYHYKFKNNTYFKNYNDFSAWGWATWKDRFEDLQKLTPIWYRKKLNFYNFFKLYFKCGSNITMFWYNICDRPSNEIQLTDYALRIYIGLNNKCSIMPKISMVKNIGTDGSGVNFQAFDKNLIKRFNNQEIYNEISFNFKGTGKEYMFQNIIINIKQSYEKSFNFFIVLRYFIRRMIFKIRHFYK